MESKAIKTGQSISNGMAWMDRHKLILPSSVILILGVIVLCATDPGNMLYVGVR